TRAILRGKCFSPINSVCSATIGPTARSEEAVRCAKVLPCYKDGDLRKVRPAMTIRYHDRHGMRIPDYVCQSQCIEKGLPVCQCIHGETVDKAIGELLIESVTPIALEVVLQVQREIETRLAEAHRLRLQHVQRLQY